MYSFVSNYTIHPKTKVFPQKITIFIVACVLRNCFVDFCQISCKPISSLEGTLVTFKISSSSNWRKPDQVLRNYATVQLHTWIPNSFSASIVKYTRLLMRPNCCRSFITSYKLLPYKSSKVWLILYKNGLSAVWLNWVQRYQVSLKQKGGKKGSMSV